MADASVNITAKNEIRSLGYCTVCKKSAWPDSFSATASRYWCCQCPNKVRNVIYHPAIPVATAAVESWDD